MNSIHSFLSNAFGLILLLSALFALLRPKISNRLCSSITLIAGALFLSLALCAGILPISWQPPASISIGPFPIHFSLDMLSAIFLGLLGVVSIAISLFSPGYLEHLKEKINAGQYWAALFVFLLSMAFVLISADAISFIVFWELMSLSSMALVATEHKNHQVQKAAMIYMGATRITTVFLVAGFLWMHHLSHSWQFADWHFQTPSTYMAAFLILLGFCIKAGIWPFHIWLPYAHPAAPAPVSALMSGVMIKVALYGVIRLLVFGDLNSIAVACVALFLGTVSAFWGVLFALVQHDLKRLLAYSSVENVGLILMGISISLLARTHGAIEIAALGLAAALFHCINHGLFKSLLFMGAGCVDASAHTKNLGSLGGLAKNMPWTMACFLIGSAAICALPPFNGFGSKWLIYQSFFQSAWQAQTLVGRGVALTILCILGIVGGLALASFCKAFAITFLGNARSKAAEEAKEASPGMLTAQMLLAGACAVVGVSVPYVLRFLKPTCDAAVHQTSTVQAAFTIPTAWIAVALLSFIGIVYSAVLNRSKLNKYITWECGFGELTPRCQVAPDSFAQPLAWIFSPILRYKLAFEISGKDRRHFPEKIKVEANVVSILENQVYRPALGLVGLAARWVAKLQAGSIHLYLLYLCLSLVLLLVLGTRL
jgi:hydrogenase-4 component B